MKKFSFNRNQIKYLVIVAMVIDHIAWGFVPTASVLGQIMHFIGRLTGPTMAFFIAEGYQHTRNVKKYAKRLGLFALISWAPYVLFEFRRWPIELIDGTLKHEIMAVAMYIQSMDKTLIICPFFGVIYTLFLSLLSIWLWDKGKCPKWCKVLGIIGLCLVACVGDWAFFDVLYALFLFCYRENPKKKWIAFSLVSLLSVVLSFFFGGGIINNLWQIGVFLPVILLRFFYNGESGSKKPIHKWFFYVFYPAHFMVLVLIRTLL